jgi:hypothetical protein
MSRLVPSDIAALTWKRKTPASPTDSNGIQAGFAVRSNALQIMDHECYPNPVGIHGTLRHHQLESAKIRVARQRLGGGPSNICRCPLKSCASKSVTTAKGDDRSETDVTISKKAFLES